MSERAYDSVQVEGRRLIDLWSHARISGDDVAQWLSLSGSALLAPPDPGVAQDLASFGVVEVWCEPPSSMEWHTPDGVPWTCQVTPEGNDDGWHRAWGGYSLDGAVRFAHAALSTLKAPDA